MYVTTGNGKFTPGRDYGDSILKLVLEGHRLVVRDCYSSADQETLNRRDLDTGPGGPMLTPEGLLLAGGKDGTLYVLDRKKVRQPGNNIEFRGGIYAAPAYWNGHVYVLASQDYLTDFSVKGGSLKLAAQSRQRFGNPGATLAISANGAHDGIVWLIETKVWNGPDQAAILRAYDAANLDRELYNSEQAPRRDRAGKTLRFTIPTVANGRVYVEAKGELDVYGLFPQP